MAKLGKFVERGGDSQMNKRQKKKQFKKLYGMNPKQYQQAMQLTSLEEPLKKKLWIRKQLHLQIWGVVLGESKKDCKNQFLL